MRYTPLYDKICPICNTNKCEVKSGGKFRFRALRSCSSIECRKESDNLWKQRRSDSHKGKKMSDAFKLKRKIYMMGNKINLGRKVSIETRLKQSKRMKVLKISPPVCRGEDNYNWKGGISSLRSIDFNSNRYKEWRKSVFERDRYTCQVCGIVGGKIEAHHIKLYCNHPETRYDIDNGITLCRKCHKPIRRKEHIHEEYFNRRINNGKNLLCSSSI